MSSNLRVDHIAPVDGVPTGGGGGIIQILQGSTNNRVETSSQSFVATNLSATITPKFNTSKILVSMNAFVDLNAANQRSYWTFYRSIGGGSASNVLTGSGAGRGLMEFWNPDQRIQTSIMTQYLDSPATTSAVTYTVYAVVSSGSFNLGLYDNQKFMHAMEVSG